MTTDYSGMVLLMLVSAGFLVTMLALSYLLGPKNKTKTKQLPFECGSVSVGSVAEQRFHVGYYLVAVLFILFDIEIIFMYPWAMIVEELGVMGLAQMGSFVAVLLVGLIFVWRKGVLNWN